MLGIMFWMLAIFLEVKREVLQESSQLDEKKSLIYNMGIGFVIGITLFTKQNMGVFAILTTATISIIKCIIQKKILLKEILAKMLGFFTFAEIMMLYFIISGTFNYFFDYCILGIFDFGKENLLFALHWKYAFLALILTLAIGMIKEKNDIVLLVEVVAQIFMCGICYPLSNEYHVILSMFMLFPILIRIMNYVIDNKNIFNIMNFVFLLWIIIFSTSFTARETVPVEDVLVGNSEVGVIYAAIGILIFIAIGLGLAIQNMKLMQRGVQGILILVIVIQILVCNELLKEDFAGENMEIYAGLGYSKEQMDYIKEGIDYILEKEKEGYNVHVISADASYYTAALRRNEYRFDLTLYGSLGSKGEQALIDDVSKLTNSILIKNKSLMHQEPERFDEYIKENYKEIDSFRDMKVYVTPDIAGLQRN